MSLQSAFSDCVNMFFPQLNELTLYHKNEDDNIIFYLKDKKGKTYFAFFYFNNIGYGRDLNCPMVLINELEKYFNDETEGLLLEWFITKYEIEFKRLVPTDLVKRI